VGGKDIDNHEWTVELDTGPLGCQVFGADIDGNGRQDLIIATRDASSGPDDVTVTLLLLDKANRPVPWQGTAPFSVSHLGLENLVDLDRNGRAELLYPYIDGYSRGEARAVSISVYQIADSYLNRVVGQVGGRRFPMVTPRGSLVAEEPNLTTRPSASELPTTIRAVYNGRPETCGLSGQLTLERGSERTRDQETQRIDVCEDRLALSDGRTIRYPSIIVVERPSSRSIAIVRGHEMLIAEAIAKRLNIRISGESYQSGRRPYFMWLSE
jgi:hypothetical protein